MRVPTGAGPLGFARHVAAVGLANRGFVIARHPGVRLQAMLAEHAVDALFDIGAARGDYGRELRQHGYRGRIVSFEPLHDPFATLSAVSAGDAAWTVQNLALGAEDGEAVINVASNSDSSSLLAMDEGHRAGAAHVGYVGTEQIRVARVDTVAPELLPPGSRLFLKIDTQGFEREVLAGAKSTLEQCVGLQLEVSFVPVYEGGMLVDEAISFAYDQGFRLVGMERGFATESGRVLQADAVFFRLPPAS